MHKMTVTYKDFDGKEVTETAWFHMTRTDLMKLAMNLPNDTTETFKQSQNVTQEEIRAKLVETMGEKGLVAFLETLLISSYGVRSEDGKRFKKTKEIADEFSQTMLFDEIFMTLLSDDNKATEFMNAIIPPDLDIAAK